MRMMSGRAGTCVLVLFVSGVALSACNTNGNEQEEAPQPPPRTPSPANSDAADRTATPRAVPAAVPRLTQCRDGVAPTGGFGEGDFAINPSEGTVAIHFSDTRDGRYRNVEYVVDYLTDLTCRTEPEVAALLDRLNPPGWRAHP